MLTPERNVSPKQFRTWRVGRSDLRIHALTIFSLAVAFVCLASALLVVTNLAIVRDRWARAGRATVYLQDGVTDSNRNDLKRALEHTPGVEHVRFVSHEEARREVVSDDRDELLASLTPDAFPESLEVAFASTITDQELESMTVKLRALPSVDGVETYSRWTERLSNLLGGGVTASLCLALVVLCAVVSVIGSTMRLLLHQRRMEVEVLKLVGATDRFVRRPFVIEAASQGALGAATALVLLGGLFLIVRGRFDHELATLLGMSPSFLSWPMAVAIVTLGAALGAVTALFSLRKMVAV